MSRLVAHEIDERTGLENKQGFLSSGICNILAAIFKPESRKRPF